VRKNLFLLAADGGAMYFLLADAQDLPPSATRTPPQAQQPNVQGRLANEWLMLSSLAGAFRALGVGLSDDSGRVTSRIMMGIMRLRHALARGEQNHEFQAVPCGQRERVTKQDLVPPEYRGFDLPGLVFLPGSHGGSHNAKNSNT